MIRLIRVLNSSQKLRENSKNIDYSAGRAQKGRMSDRGRGLGLEGLSGVRL